MQERAHAAPAARHSAWTATLALVLAGAAVALAASQARAQETTFEPLSEEELETLVGPIALYPDEILALILPASTYPLQIVEAARFLDAREENPNASPDEDWDDSVVALLNYPEVVRLLNDDLDWTWTLGEAVLDDQGAVLDAVQTFRDRAYAAGNLRSDDRQVVTESDDGVIEIAPGDPEVVYIPYYEPETVVVYQPRRVYHYYPYAYPLYYYPYPVGHRFNLGFFWGVTSAFTIGWHTHHLHVHHHTHYGHPYYRRAYYTPYYHRHGVHVTVNVNNYRNVWRPHHRRGARPYDGHRARVDARGERIYDGRRYRYRGEDGAVRTVAGTREGVARDQRSVREQRLARDERVARNLEAAGADPRALRNRDTTARDATGRRSRVVRDPQSGNIRTVPDRPQRVTGGGDRRTTIGGVAADAGSATAGDRARPRTAGRPSRSASGTTGQGSQGRSGARTNRGAITGVAPSSRPQSREPASGVSRLSRARPTTPSAPRASGTARVRSPAENRNSRTGARTQPRSGISQPRVSAQPRGGASQPRVRAQPRVGASQPRVNAQPRAGASQPRVNAQPHAGASQPRVSAQPRSAGPRASGQARSGGQSRGRVVGQAQRRER